MQRFRVRLQESRRRLPIRAVHITSWLPSPSSLPLHESGALTLDEFAAAKARLLSGPSSA
ncbi:hypothetical protein ACVW00_001823 [Marmoricola sp. URHA0025 HA25]